MKMYDYERTETVSVEHGAKQRSFEMPMMHTHGCHELYFLVSGQRRYLIGSKLYEVSPGNIVLVPRNRLHRTTMVNRKGHSRYVVYFSEEYLHDFIALIGQEAFDGFMEKGCLRLPETDVTSVHDTLRQMDRDQKQNAPLAQAYLKTALQHILLLLLRRGEAVDNAADHSAGKIQEATRYITDNFAMDLTLEDAASIACMEKTYFCKCFKNLTGFGFTEYLTRVRIQAAENYLQNTDLSVSEIARRCGFSGSNYFGDVFRRCIGVSPSAFRKQYRP